MRSNMVPGAVFPDYELSDHTGKHRKLSELQGPDPMVLVLSRGSFCPKDRRQADGLVAAPSRDRGRLLPAGHYQHRQYRRDQRVSQRRGRALALPVGPAAHRAEGSRHRRIHRPRPQSDDPAHDRSRARSCHLQDIQRLLVLGRPTMEELRQDLRAVTQEMPAGLGHHDARIQSGVGTGPQGAFLSLWKDVRSRRSANRISWRCQQEVRNAKRRRLITRPHQPGQATAAPAAPPAPPPAPTAAPAAPAPAPTAATPPSRPVPPPPPTAAPSNAGVIENRTLAAASVEGAVRTAKRIVLNTPVPGFTAFA